MALTQIVPDIEYRRYLGKTSITDNDAALLNLLIGVVERAIRAEVQNGIVQTTYTHILPPLNPESQNRRLSVGFIGPHIERLQLPEFPVRSITSVYEDADAYGGDGTDSPWAAATELTLGTDFSVDWDQTGLCMSGYLISQSNNNSNNATFGTGWCTVPGSIRVIYSAGWSASELDGDVTDYNLDAKDIKLACLETMKYMWAKSKASASIGIKKEKLADYEVENFDTAGESLNLHTMVTVPPLARGLLQRFQRVTSMVY